MSDYPLKSLVEIREGERDEAVSELARLVSDADRLEMELEKLRTTISERSSALTTVKHAERERVEHTLDLSSLGQLREFEAAVNAEIQELRADAENLAGQLVAAKREVRDARERLVEAERQLTVVSKHREAWESERMRIAERKSEIEMDEAGLARWNREKK